MAEQNVERELESLRKTIKVSYRAHRREMFLFLEVEIYQNFFQLIFFRKVFGYFFTL